MDKQTYNPAQLFLWFLHATRIAKNTHLPLLSWQAHARHRYDISGPANASSCSWVMLIHAVWSHDWQLSQQMLSWLSVQFWRQNLHGQGWPSKRILLQRCMTTDTHESWCLLIYFWTAYQCQCPRGVLNYWQLPIVKLLRPPLKADEAGGVCDASPALHELPASPAYYSMARIIHTVHVIRVISHWSICLAGFNG